MRLIEIAKRRARKIGSSLCVFVPRSWLGMNALNAGMLVYAHCGAVREEIRYYPDDGPGRIPVKLQLRDPRKVFVVMPSDGTRRFGIEKGAELSLLVNQTGTLVVRRAV